jgi:AsmA protein
MKRWQKVLAIVALAAVVIVTALLFVLDSIVTSKARDEAASLSKQWGRPVAIGSVATKFITGLGVRVSDVSIGPGPGEGVPLLDLRRVEVKMALLKAALSRGKDVDIRSAEIEGLTVNIVRLPDGTTNLEALQKKIAESAPPPKKEEPAAKPTDLSFLRIDHAALRDAKIAFIDKSGESARELAIQHLDVSVEDLRAGKPLEIVLKAAVLAEKQNLEVHVKAAPLPPTLTPTPTSVVLKIKPAVDIGPLGPFIGKEVGLRAGTLDADFQAELGGAVPGGKGPTSVKGTVKLAGLRFKAAEKPLDVTLDTDVKGDAAAGDVQIDKLKLDIGPAGITGHGRAHGLNSPAPRIEGLEIVGHDLDPAKLAAYYPPLREQLKGQIAGPIGLDLRARGSSAAQALELKLDFTPVKLAVPETLSKAAGAPMTIVAHVKGAAASGGPLRFDAKIDLTGVDLRPGQSIAKAPGQRLDVALDGSRTSNKSSSSPEQKIELADVKAHILDDELEGRGFVEMKGAGAKKTTRFELALASSHLDLDKMLIPTPSKKEKKPLDPKTFAGLSGHAAVKIDRLRMEKQEMTDIVADVTMDEDDIKVNKAELKAFGGSVSAGGTEIKLAHPQQPFHLVTKLTGIETSNLLAMGTEKKILAGKFNGGIDLKGGSQEMKDLARTLAGNLDGHLLDGAFYGKDLIASVTGPLAKSLPFGLAGKTTQGGTTNLGKDLPFGVTIENGLAKLKQPITVKRPEAEMSFTGGIHVDGNLDLPGTISLAPQTIAAITGGKVTPKEPVPVKLRVTGPAWNPSITDLDLKPAVESIVKQAGSALLGKALGVDNVDEAAKKKQEELQKQAEQKAQEEAEAQKKKVEEEAKNRLKGLFGK